MNVPEFQAKWRGATLKERSAAQEHFLDLCRLLGMPTPAEGDKTGACYAFELQRPFARVSTNLVGWRCEVAQATGRADFTVAVGFGTTGRRRPFGGDQTGGSGGYGTCSRAPTGTAVRKRLRRASRAASTWILPLAESNAPTLESASGDGQEKTTQYPRASGGR
jgi:hypothetical protein